jgi:DNA-binding GntR family transcriptional regulator
MREKPVVLTFTCMYTDPYTDSTSRGERVFSDLKARLLAGEFPVGRRLGEERLASLLDVSRTPVREALHRLHTEGIVVRHPDGGFVPAVPDVVTMRTLYEVRVGLEIQALRRPAGLGLAHDRARVEQLHADWTALQADGPEATPEFVLRDESFHIALADAAGNPVLVEFLRTVNERIRIVRMQDFLSQDRIEETIAQHLAIAEAVLQGDTELAVRRFDNHLTESLAVVEQRTLRALALMATREEQAP